MKITRSLLTSISQFPYRSTPISLSSSPTLPLISKSNIAEELQKTNPPIKTTSAIYDLSPHIKLEPDRKGLRDFIILLQGDPYESVRAGFRKLLEAEGHITHNRALSLLVYPKEFVLAMGKEFDLAMGKKFGLAMGIYGDMLKRNIPRGHESFNYLIDLLVQTGQIQGAIQMFEEMKEIRISPDATIYTNLLKRSCEYQKTNPPSIISVPTSFWEHFSLGEPDRYKLLSAFWEDFSLGEPDRYDPEDEGRITHKAMFGLAMGIYGDMLKRNIPLDYESLNRLTDLLVQTGQIEDAIQLFEEMEEIGISPNSHDYSRLMQWLFGAGRFEEAFKCYNNLLEDNFSPERDLYSIMIKGYTAAGKIDDAFSILREWWSREKADEYSFDFHGSDNYFYYESYCFLVLLKRLVDHGLWNRARLLVNRMMRFDEPHPIYAIMIGWLCKAGFVDDAQQLFDDFWFPEVMRCLDVELFQADVRLRRYNSLLHRLIKLEEFDHAMAVYNDMLKRNIHRNWDTFNCVIDVLVKIGKIQDAIHLFDEMGELVSLDGYNCLIDRLFEAGHFEEASYPPAAVDPT